MWSSWNCAYFQWKTATACSAQHCHLWIRAALPALFTLHHAVARVRASRRSRSDAPVIRRKTPPRRQRVLSPSSAQWSPGSSLGLWCKSSLLFAKIKTRSRQGWVGGELRLGCGYWGRLRQCALPDVCKAIRFRIRRRCVKESRCAFINIWLESGLNSSGFYFAMSAALGPGRPYCDQGVGAQAPTPLYL